MKSQEAIVQTFLNALNNEDFKTAKSCLNDDFSFTGPLGERNGADQYIGDMEKMKFKYEIEKVFSNDDEVCVIYKIDMLGKAKITTCGLYKLENNKLSSLNVIFDPRPVLQK